MARGTYYKLRCEERLRLLREGKAPKPSKSRWPKKSLPKAPKPVPPLQAKPETTVYFIQKGEGGPIKIGFSHVVEYRLIALQSTNLDELRVLHALPGDRQLERRLHAAFAKHRIRGEWFHPNRDLLDFIEAAKAATASSTPSS